MLKTISREGGSLSNVTCTTLTTGGEAVIKAQVLAGGRGKGHFDSGLQGGVKLAKRYIVMLLHALGDTVSFLLMCI